MIALDDAPVEAPLNHEASGQRLKQAFRNAHNVFLSLKELDTPARITKAFESNRIVVSVYDESARVQVYFPDYRVAGEGRCACEAGAEAVEALCSLLEGVRAAQDWNVFPERDTSLKTQIAVVRSTISVMLLHLTSRLSMSLAGHGHDNAESLDEIKSGLSFA